MKKEDYTYVPLINDKENDCKVMRWLSIFTDCISRTHGSRGPLVYVIRESSEVPSDVNDTLDADSYHGGSGSLHDKMVARLSNNCSIYKHDNT